jgi:hypothetical protein
MCSDLLMKRPKLTKNIDIKTFLDYYWLKSELIQFCKIYKLNTTGNKFDLLKRVQYFIETGNKNKTISKTNSLKYKQDSLNKLDKNSLVLNYKNDKKTREFFIKEIGSHFRFNDYLRSFNNRIIDINNKITYGDLIQGWITYENEKKSLNIEKVIGKQFEYNQFMRDFFKNEKGKNRQEAIEAWNFVKSLPGKRDYDSYKKKLTWRPRE